MNIGLVRHPHHLVEESPFPLLGSLGSLFFVSGVLRLFYEKRWDLFLWSLGGLIMLCYLWWKRVTTESTLLGLHTSDVEYGIRVGIVLFIISEVFLFVRFFWAYFHSRLAPEISIGGIWPPVGVMTFNVFEVPLLNTIILLASGVTLTWSHHLLILGWRTKAKALLEVTIVLGVYFTILQGIEYVESSFTIADRVYGSVFFLATGFHGAHVLIGTTFLAVKRFRISNFRFSKTHHFGFEAAAWYWHFVDVVWLFLFVAIYWWGG